MRLEAKVLSSEQTALLDADWDGTVDHRENTFREMIEAHDFVALNFYVAWCPHCTAFMPEWDRYEGCSSAS